MPRRNVMIAVSVLAAIAVVLAGCGATAVPTAAPTAAPKPPTKAPATATTVPPTPTRGPAVGGKVVFALYGDPDSLDAHHTALVTAADVLNMVGAGLLGLDPKGNYTPYLADSWKISPDGLVWDFFLKKNVKWHDGTPFTANDYVYTIQRVLDPATKASLAASNFTPVAKVEAPDAYTLRLTLTNPYFPMLYNLAGEGSWLTQPLQKAAVEKAGANYGRAPMGVGPYVFKQWVTGQTITLERNPDFSWGPPYQHQGPAYVQTIEYRIIPEMSTLLAALETGELDIADMYVSLQAKDIPRIQATKKFRIDEGLQRGMRPFVTVNVSKPPFDDVKVRQAFNLAIDRKAMIQAMTQGNGVEQKGPLSPSMIGYWSGVEQIGYGYDLSKAKQLMADAGYKPGASGVLEKNGQPLKFTLIALPQDVWVKSAQICQEAWKVLGADVSIEQQESAVAIKAYLTGNYTAGTLGITAGEADMMFLLFHSSNIGGYDMAQVKDPELDDVLMKTRTLTDPAQRQAVVEQAQKLIVEKALAIFLYVPKTFTALNLRVNGALYSAGTNMLYLHDAYVETK